MPWDTLEDDINAEFASFEVDDATEAELYRRYRVKAERSFRKTQRSALAGAPPQTCEACGVVLKPKARGPVALTCSERCKKARQRGKRVPSLSALVHDHYVTTRKEAETPEPADRYA